MDDRIEQELSLLRRHWPNMKYDDSGRWICLPDYPLPKNWSLSYIDLVFQIPVGYPGTLPYGIFVPQGLMVDGQQPSNFAASGHVIPFKGNWWILSWTPDDGQWKATADLLKGSNLLNWAIGFSKRFNEGK